MSTLEIICPFFGYNIIHLPDFLTKQRQDNAEVELGSNMFS